MKPPGVNGEFTLGENIGDLGGLGIAIVAYRMYLADRGLTLADTPVRPFVAEGGSPELAKHEFRGCSACFWRGRMCGGRRPARSWMCS